MRSPVRRQVSAHITGDTEPGRSRTTIHGDMTYIEGKQVAIESGIKTLPEEIPYMTYTYIKDIAQIGGEENVVWRVLLMCLLELGSGFMGRLVSIIFVWAKTELQMVRDGLF